MAQAGWPSRQITLVVPFAAGGAVDIVGRALAQALDASSVPPGPVLAGVYGAELITLPGTGHTPMIERRGPMALAGVLQWIDRRVLALG